jgi:hypothetical protein
MGKCCWVGIDIKGLKRGNWRKWDFGWSLALLDHYLKGAAYGSGGADGFAMGAPAALFRFDNSDNIVNQHQGVTMANADTQPTPVTLFSLYGWHFSHCYRPLSIIILSPELNS